MAVTSGDFQPTPLSPRAAPAEPGPPGAADRGARPGRRSATPRPASPTDPSRIGVVLVHGIGTQQPAETFLDWSGPLVEQLSAWRLEHGHGVDPVRRAEFSFSGASSPYLELAVPAVDDHPAQTWLVTEAWWAAQVRPPSLATMTAYLRRGLPWILAGIKAGYESREAAWRERRALSQRVAATMASSETLAGQVRGPTADASGPDAAVAPGARAEPSARAEADARGALQAGTAPVVSTDVAQATLARDELTPDPRWAWIELLDRIQKELTILAAAPALLLGTLVLLVYAPFRALPIAALRDAAILRSADSKLTDWFGDLPDLLDDPVQAANVRARLGATIAGLRDLGCGRIVIVAHSGGAIVAWTTLLDETFADLPVASLVTLGEGLALAWRLEDAARGLPLGSRLAGSLPATRPDLRWFDYWATYDPAPGGRLTPPPAAVLNVDSRPITNRMSILDDHGAYWDNDEGFVMALLRHLDTAGDAPDGSRFFPDDALRAVRIERRRQRVAVLAAWRWVAALGAILPIGVTTLLALLGIGSGPARLGAAVSGWWGSLPFGGLVGAPLDWVASWAAWPDPLRSLGEWLLGTATIAGAFLLLGRIGSDAWDGWDRRERLAARAARLAPLDRRAPITTFLVLAVVAALLAALFGVWLLGH